MYKPLFICFFILVAIFNQSKAQDSEQESESTPIADTTINPVKESIEEPESADEVVVEEEIIPRKPTRNFIKMNLWNIPLRNYSFQVERVLTKRLSIAVGYRTMPEDGLPLIEQFKAVSGMDESFPEDKELLDQVRAVKVSNTAITPEIRLYIGKKGYGRGFYLAPFYRMATYTLNGYSQNYEAGNRLNTVTVSGKITAESYGLMMGAQWKLARFISLDWWILGGHVGNHTGEFTAQKDIAFTGDEKSLILENADTFSISNIKTGTPTFPTENTVKVTSAGIWGGVRAGLCLGISF
ncbi:MAG: hypothetical protein KGP35_05690 [Bacteroidetes bacterium]|nr:hypothetical protein [Bacteroidota bacterium]